MTDWNWMSFAIGMLVGSLWATSVWLFTILLKWRRNKWTPDDLDWTIPFTAYVEWPEEQDNDT